MRIFGTGPDRLVDLADVNPAALANGYAPVWNLATLKFTMQPVVVGSGVSLSDITAGTLQVPLNMVRTNTVTAGTTQLVGTSGGPVLNAITGDEAKIQVNGVTGLSISASTNPANGTLLLNPNASNASFIAICAANTADSAAGPMIYMGGGSYSTHPNGDAARNKMLFMMPATSPVGGVAGEFQWWHNKFDPATGGLELMSLVTGGVLSLYKSNTIAASISPASLTATRAFTLPDAAGELMVSGGSGSVSLSNLTAGTLAVALTLPSNLTVTAANRELIGTSAGVQRNTPTGTTIIDSVNGTAVQTLSSTINTQAVPIKWSTNVALTSTDYAIGKHTTTRLALSVPASADIGFYVNGAFYGAWDATGINLSSAASDIITFSAHAGSGNRKLFGSFYGIEVDCLDFYYSPSSTQTVSLGTYGIKLITGAGSVTAGTRGIYQTSAGVVVNTPTSTSASLAVNGSSIVRAGANVSGTQADTSWHIGGSATNYISNTAGTGITHLVLASNYHLFQTDGGLVGILNLGRDNVGTVHKYNWRIGTSVDGYINNTTLTGMTITATGTITYQVPASSHHTFQTNAGSTTIARFGMDVSGNIANNNWYVGTAAGNYLSNTDGTAITGNVLTGNYWRFNVAGSSVLGIGRNVTGTQGDNNWHIGVNGQTVISNTNGTSLTVATSGTTLLTFDTQIKVTTSKNLVMGTAAIATTATDGFLYLPTCAGTPTGVPTDNTGTCAFVYDTTNNKLYVYNGAWKATAALT